MFVGSQVLQKWRLPGAKFLPTSNKRCEMMFQEAASFASHLKKLEMNIRRLQRDIECEGSGLVECTDQTVRVDLPDLLFLSCVNALGYVGGDFMSVKVDKWCIASKLFYGFKTQHVQRWWVVLVVVFKMQKCLVCCAVAMALDTRNIMLYSLPRTYNFTPSGQAVPDEPDPVLIGQNVLLDRLTVAIHTLKQRMQQDVFVPLTSWITAFTKVQVGVPVCQERCWI